MIIPLMHTINNIKGKRLVALYISNSIKRYHYNKDVNSTRVPQSLILILALAILKHKLALRCVLIIIPVLHGMDDILTPQTDD